MNCSVCGSPLLFDRVVFRCACGAYVHAYCADKHIVDSHRPEMEEGYADLNGDFHPKQQPEPVGVATAEAEVAVSSETEEEESVIFDEELVADAELTGEADNETSSEELDEDS